MTTISSALRDQMANEVTILAEGLAFPEGPAFDPFGNLWFVEVDGGNLVRWAAGQLDRYATGGSPNGLAFDGDGCAWFCDAHQNAIRRFMPSTREWQTFVDRFGGRPLDRPNDLAFDVQGNLVFTCPGRSLHTPNGYVCCLKSSGDLAKIGDKLYFPNGLAFADGGRELVLAETYRQRLWRGKWDAGETRWIDPVPYVHLDGKPGPDGMALGADGLLYVAMFGSGHITVINAAGRVVKTYEVLGAKPTNVAFDPAGQLGLVVTEAEQGLLLSLPHLGPGVPLYQGGGAW